MGQHPESTFLIDGYNLLRRAFTYLRGADLQAAREKLEVRLREFQRALGTRTRLVVVYDGALGVPSRSSPAVGS